MEIKIGDKFEKQLNSRVRVVCEVYDIFTQTTTSTLTGNVLETIIYYATSSVYGMGKPFEVPKSTIVRGKI
jgi:hypothetical protein